MVRLRLKRFGRRNRPFYRLSAFDQRSPRDGRAIEELGWYNPMAEDDAKKVQFDTERVNYWLGVGARPTETVAALLKKAGIEVKGDKKRKHAPAGKA